MSRHVCNPWIALPLMAAVLLAFGGSSRAALLAYEPFTNAAGTAIIGSVGGSGFGGAWQANSSQGVATNTGYGLGYTDAAHHVLAAAGGAGFFQGLTTANSSMQPNRALGFTRGTNGGAATTWISLLLVRQGPTNGTAANPYARGVNITFDYPDSSSGVNQRVGVGNSSGAATNTVGILSAGGNLRASANPPSQYGGGYGSFPRLTNFVVLRIDHLGGTPQQANDNAYLWVNPADLSVEPSIGSATTNVLGLYDYSIGLVRVFVGGQNSTAQPYGEAMVDEIRVGETYADVAPYGGAPASADLVITQARIMAGGIALSGTGGTRGAPYQLLGNANLTLPATNWPVLATNYFDANGDFALTHPLQAGAGAQFYRLRMGASAPVVSPFDLSGPSSLTVTQGQTAVFGITANGSAPFSYQWFYNTNTLLSGQTASSLTLGNVQAANAGVYSVQVSNGGGALTSTQAVLTVLQPPSIAVQPVNQATPQAAGATFSVVAAGTLPLRYQWYFNTNTPVAYATNASLVLSNAQPPNAGMYSVLITNLYGSVTSDFVRLTVNGTSLTNGAYFVSPSGSDAHPGTLSQPFLTVSRGLTAIGNGGLLYLRAGTYALGSKLSLSKVASPTNTLRIWAYPGENAVIDSTGNTSDGISISGSGYHLKGLTVMKAGHNGINLSGNSNIVEFCTVHDNGNTGLHITGGSGGTTFPAYNLILNCDSYLNYDPPVGGNADGFSAKWNLGDGNVFSGCRAWWNSDDGWDFWMGDSPVIITNSWAFHNGTNYWNEPLFNGNGQGFKLGGNYVGAPHRLVRSIAFGNESNGVDQNNNLSGQTLDNNTSWANKGRNFSMAHGTNLTPHLVRNNLSFAAASSDAFTSGTLSTNNSWQLLTSPSANAGDVQSVDESVATAPRNPDGSLPAGIFLRPVPGGRLIDRGVNVGDSFSGSAPDLGALEVGP